MKIEKKDGEFIINNGNDEYNKPEEKDIDVDIEKKEEKPKSLNHMKKMQLFS